MQPWRRVNVFIGDLLAGAAVNGKRVAFAFHGIAQSRRAARVHASVPSGPWHTSKDGRLGCIFVVIGNLLHAPMRGPALSRVTAATSADEPRLCRVAMVFLSPGACRKGFVVVDYRTVRERYKEPINAVAYARCGTGGRTAGCCRPGA